MTSNKIEAQDYFKDSRLFTAKQTAGKPTNSATSSAVKYELTCSECGDTTTRTGNNKNLHTCGSCGVVWDRDTNEIRGPGSRDAASVKRVVKPAVLGSDNDTDGEFFEREIVRPSTRRRAIDSVGRDAPAPAPAVKPATPAPAPKKGKITAESIADVLLKSSKGELEPRATPEKTKKLKKKEDSTYEVEEIVDYYDDRLEDRWHRQYFVQWKGYDQPSFVLDVDFVDKKFLAEFEASLPEEERFATIFPPKNRKNKGTKHAVRSKVDVLRDYDGDIEPAETVEKITEKASAATEPPNDCITIEQGSYKVVKLKIGQIYRIGDTFIEAVL